MESSYIRFIELVSPAVILGVLAYLTNFYGRAIADQKSFSDDRKWEVQLNGTMFLAQYIIPSAYFGFLLSAHVGTLGMPFSLRSLLVILLTSLTSIVSTVASRKLYNLPPVIKEEQKIAAKEKLHAALEKGGYSEEFKKYMKETSADLWHNGNEFVKNHKVKIFLIATLYMWMLIAEIRQYLENGFSSTGLAQLLFLALLVFMGFFVLAFSRSMQLNKKLLIVDIYLRNGSIMQDVFLLKVNETNIRFRVGEDKLVIMNRDEVERIEAIRGKNPE